MSRVTCEALRDALRAGTSPADAELVSHAASCEACTALLAERASVGRALAAETLESGAPLPWSGLETLMKEEVGWRAWVRSRPTPVRLAFAYGAFALVGSLGLRRVRPDLELVPGLELGGLLVVFGVTAYQALGPALPVAGRPASRPGILALALAVPALAAFVRTATTLAPAADAATFVHQAWSCFGYGALLTAPLLAVLWLMDRGAGSPSRVFYSAAVAGLAANAALTLHCPNASSAHLLVGHATIGLALAAVAGLFQGRR